MSGVGDITLGITIDSIAVNLDDIVVVCGLLILTFVAPACTKCYIVFVV